MLSPTQFAIGQTPMFFFIIRDKETGNLIAKSSVTEIRYSLYKESPGARLPVEGHDHIEVSKVTFYDELQPSSLCSFSDGFNFKFSPDSTEHPFFPDSGLYRLMVTFAFTARNPYAESVQFFVG